MDSFIQIWKIIGLLFAVIILIFSVVMFLRKPSHDGNWEVGQEELPEIQVDGDVIRVSNFRDFIWEKDGDVDKRYTIQEYKLSEIEKVDVIISHFSDFEGLAHIFLSFGFTDGRHLVVSMETRREAGEEFSPILGLMRKFEIIYVVGSERDIVGLRTNVREGERVYVYPTIASPEKSKDLFLKLAGDINDIYVEPRFYNTLLRNCTNVITRRVEGISDLKFPLTYKTVMPGFFDEVLYDMGIIASRSDFEETKQYYLVDNKEVDYMSEDFSVQIR
ncbi:DUF4105 domain-containing protein [Patescibacteria group bacterium]